MTDFFLVADRILILVLLMGAGYLALKGRILTLPALKGLSGFVVNVTIPALIIASLQVPVSPERLSGAGEIIVLSVLFYGLALLVAAVTVKLLGVASSERGVFQFAIVFPNVGFMGFPIIESLYGIESLFYVVIVNLIFNILVFSLGILLITDGKGQKSQFKPAMLLNAGIVASLVGFVLFLSSTRIPSPVIDAVSLLGGITTPLAMVVVGGLLATFPARKMLEDWRIPFVGIIRLVIIPLILLATLTPFAGEFPTYGIFIILSAMPSAAYTVIFAEEYGADAMLASRIVFISTLMSLVTIPLISLSVL